MAQSTKGIRVFISKAGIAPTDLVPTAISTAKPAVVSVASVTGITAGSLVKIEGTNVAELDNRWFTVGTVDTGANTFTLVGSDTSGHTGAITLGTNSVAHVHKAADMLSICLASIDFSSETPQAISVGTFCVPTASLAQASSTAGTITMTGYVDTTSADYAELILAEIDGKERVVDIALPNKMGNIVAPFTISAISWSLPLEGAIGFTASGALGAKPIHLF